MLQLACCFLFSYITFGNLSFPPFQVSRLSFWCSWVVCCFFHLVFYTILALDVSLCSLQNRVSVFKVIFLAIFVCRVGRETKAMAASSPVGRHHGANDNFPVEMVCAPNLTTSFIIGKRLSSLQWSKILEDLLNSHARGLLTRNASSLSENPSSKSIGSGLEVNYLVCVNKALEFSLPWCRLERNCCTIRGVLMHNENTWAYFRGVHSVQKLQAHTRFFKCYLQNPVPARLWAIRARL